MDFHINPILLKAAWIHGLKWPDEVKQHVPVPLK
jgi:hypothetical protein